MLTTRFKVKIGKHWSHPIGAIQLSQALSGVPGLEDFALRYYRQYRERDGTWRVMGVRYIYSPEYHYMDPFMWQIDVHAIPRVIKGRVTPALIADALPKVVRPWLLDRVGIRGCEGSTFVVIKATDDNGSISYMLSKHEPIEVLSKGRKKSATDE